MNNLSNTLVKELDTRFMTVAEVISRQPSNPAYIRGRLFEKLKPFALFDAGKVGKAELTIPWHPHSGVATITFPYDAVLNHADSEGNGDTIQSRGLQWMASGSGVWHQEHYVAEHNNIGIIQLWLLLPPEEETAKVNYFNIQPQEIPASDNVRVLLGEYNGINSKAKISHDVTYLHVTLNQGETFAWLPPTSQTRGFVYSLSGQLSIDNTTFNTEQLALLEERTELQVNAELTITAETKSEFVVALTSPWLYPVVNHFGSIHTNQAALIKGNQQIQQLGQKLAQQGKL